jgi:sulfur carrier protein
MIIFLNGQPHELTIQMTVHELLVSIGYGDKPCVVELDEQPVFPRNYPTVILVAGAKVEVVTLAAGG